MAIQFRCPGCGQPIEVDEVWAQQAVTCPYCRKTVTAPAESTFSAGAGQPVASPVAVLAGRAPAPSPGGGAYVPLVGIGTGNTLAIWAMGLTVAAFLLSFISPYFFGEHAKEMSDPAVARRTIEQAMSGNTPGWLLGMIVLSLTGFGLWLAGLVCGIIAVSRRVRRRLSIMALVLSLMMLAVMCLGVFASLTGSVAG